MARYCQWSRRPPASTIEMRSGEAFTPFMCMRKFAHTRPAQATGGARRHACARRRWRDMACRVRQPTAEQVFLPASARGGNRAR